MHRVQVIARFIKLFTYGYLHYSGFEGRTLMACSGPKTDVYRLHVYMTCLFCHGVKRRPLLVLFTWFQYVPVLVVMG